MFLNVMGAGRNYQSIKRSGAVGDAKVKQTIQKPVVNYRPGKEW